MKDYYKILEVNPNASQESIKEQYRFLIQAWHPDKFPNSAQKAKAEEKTKELNEAYAILSNPTRRAQYDSELSSSWFAEKEYKQENSRAEATKSRAEQERQQRNQEEARRNADQQRRQREEAEAQQRRAEYERQKREEVESSRRVSKERRSLLALVALILIIVVGYSALTVNQPPQTLDQLNTQESISFELSLTEASREYVDAVLKGSDDTIKKYYNPEYSQAKGVPTAFNDPRWGNGITYSPLDVDELKPCFEKISIDSTDIDFKADPRSWDVLIIDRDATDYFFTTKDGNRAIVAFYVRGRRGGPYYLNSIFVLDCN